MTEKEERQNAVLWFMNLKTAFKDTEYDRYLDLAIEGISKNGGLAEANILDKNLSEYHDKLGARAYNRLMMANIHTFRDLTYITITNVLSMRNCGKITAYQIISFAKDHGIEICDCAMELQDTYPERFIGETVILRSDIDRNNKKGDVVKITDMNTRNVHSKCSFRLPIYSFKDKMGKTIWVSPGQII